MKKPDSGLPKFTKNEKAVLKSIIGQAKIPDLEIAKKMGLSQQAIFKIRHKLESAGVITGYMPIIDFKKIGIQTLAVIGIRFTSFMWDKYSEDQIAERVRKIPQVMIAYRIPESRISHLLVLGFNDTAEKDAYLMRMQSRYSKELELIQVYSFSVDRIIKTNQVGLLGTILSPKNSPPPEFFPD